MNMLRFTLFLAAKSTADSGRNALHQAKTTDNIIAVIPVVPVCSVSAAIIQTNGSISNAAVVEAK